MEQNPQPKKQKSSSKAGTYKSIRLSPETAKKLSKIHQAVNKKQFGKKVQPDAILSLALGQLSDSHFKELQEKSLSNNDHLEMAFREYLKKHPSISKDDFLGIVARGEIQIFSSESLATTEKKSEFSDT